jgi:electron transfer flavoprotein alpha subunit
VISSFQNEEGKRKCKFIDMNQLTDAIKEGLEKENQRLKPMQKSKELLTKVWIVGETPRSFAESISEDIVVIHKEDFMNSEAFCHKSSNIHNDTRTFAECFAAYVQEKQPEAILWGSDPWSKAVAPQVAALLRTGLCADCTALETDGDKLFMYRPAFSGNIVAKIACMTKPQMATVRTLESGNTDVVCALGKGAKNVVRDIQTLVQQKNEKAETEKTPRWDIAASRLAVDAEMLPYERQVGITGKSVNPAVYLAIGISGAVHHIAGMKQSGIVIAVNPDRKAPIFDYADYGIVGTAEEVLRYLM